MYKLCTKQTTKLQGNEHSWNHGCFDQEQVFTSPSSSSYQACHGVAVGSLRASMLYLVDVTGITASVSPLDKVKKRLKQNILIYHIIYTSHSYMMFEVHRVGKVTKALAASYCRSKLQTMLNVNRD